VSVSFLFPLFYAICCAVTAAFLVATLPSGAAAIVAGLAIFVALVILIAVFNKQGKKYIHDTNSVLRQQLHGASASGPRTETMASGSSPPRSP
jgi:hypothetical protein